MKLIFGITVKFCMDIVYIIQSSIHILYNQGGAGRVIYLNMSEVAPNRSLVSGICAFRDAFTSSSFWLIIVRQKAESILPFSCELRAKATRFAASHSIDDNEEEEYDNGQILLALYSTGSWKDAKYLCPSTKKNLVE
ncbi:hypothetical protein OUZ56_001037 [Daphnia magna]|uniref:Uncharacterized protein n=1 Tax=Daphnia magna TaxID=35525 RepID=A0ABR0A1K9_9CRUS|nr:hypothetical protein OUZ56_001037 [Daphnia magna]